MWADSRSVSPSESSGDSSATPISARPPNQQACWSAGTRYPRRARTLVARTYSAAGSSSR